MKAGPLWAKLSVWLPLVVGVAVAVLVYSLKDKARQNDATAGLVNLAVGLKSYHRTNGSYPTEEQGLDALTTKPTAHPVPVTWVAVMESIPLDPWGRPYHYTVRVQDGQKVHVLSSDGPDAANTADDIELVVDSKATDQK